VCSFPVYGDAIDFGLGVGFGYLGLVGAFYFVDEVLLANVFGLVVHMMLCFVFGVLRALTASLCDR